MKILEGIKKNPLFFILMIMCGISCFAIYNAVPIVTNVYNPSRLPYMQLIYYMLGGILAYMIYRVGMDTMYNNIKLIYWLFMILLIGLAVDHFAYTRLLHHHVVPLAKFVNGATSWYRLPGFSFQPSEFMKIIVVMYLAQMTKEFNDEQLIRTANSEFRYIVEVCKIALPPAILIYLQNDSGVMLILMAAVFFVLVSSGLRRQWFILIFALGFSLIALMTYLFLYHNDIFTRFINGHTLKRIYGWLDPEGTTADEGLQLWYSMLSYGTASWVGHGMRAVVKVFPEGHTDFIFAVIATDFGFIGAFITLAAVIALDVVLLHIGLSSSNDRDQYFTMGVLGSLMFQQIWNIGMILGFLPITGITLPLISYGGSSLLSYMMAMGVFIDINYNNQILDIDSKYNLKGRKL